MVVDGALTELEAQPGAPIGDERWVNIINPDSSWIAELENRLGVPRSFMLHALDLDEVARIEKDGTATLIVLRIPYFQGSAAAIPYISIPLGIIVAQQRVITICKLPIAWVPEVRAQCIADDAPVDPARVVLGLLLRTAEQYLSAVREINRAVDLVEERLQHALRNEEVMELLQFQKSLTHFATALELNDILLERLRQDPLLKQHPEDADLLADVRTEMRQAVAMTRIASDILSQMMDAFVSIISNNLNMVMKFLTAFTIVLTFPVMIASFYGMNVVLPGQQASSAFLLLVALSFGSALTVALVLWKKRWL